MKMICTVLHNAYSAHIQHAIVALWFEIQKSVIVENLSSEYNNKLCEILGMCTMKTSQARTRKHVQQVTGLAHKFPPRRIEQVLRECTASTASA